MARRWWAERAVGFDVEQREETLKASKCCFDGFAVAAVAVPAAAATAFRSRVRAHAFLIFYFVVQRLRYIHLQATCRVGILYSRVPSPCGLLKGF